jgi:hypothetical protein
MKVAPGSVRTRKREAVLRVAVQQMPNVAPNWMTVVDFGRGVFPLLRRWFWPVGPGLCPAFQGPKQPPGERMVNFPTPTRFLHARPPAMRCHPFCSTC